jgi:hypothetical protein
LLGKDENAFSHPYFFTVPVDGNTVIFPLYYSTTSSFFSAALLPFDRLLIPAAGGYSFLLPAARWRSLALPSRLGFQSAYSTIMAKDYFFFQ